MSAAELAGEAGLRAFGLGAIADLAFGLIVYGLMRFALWIMFPRVRDEMEPDEWL